jgi:hypothetical protein
MLMHEVCGGKERADDAHPPKGERDSALSVLLAVKPLKEEPEPKHGLPAKANAQPSPFEQAMWHIRVRNMKPQDLYR